MSQLTEHSTGGVKVRVTKRQTLIINTEENRFELLLLIDEDAFFRILFFIYKKHKNRLLKLIKSVQRKRIETR